MPQGLKRRISRQQGQRESTFQQGVFAGGLNTDIPASLVQSNVRAIRRIKLNQLAQLTNMIAFTFYLAGHYGRKRYTTVPIPGSGDVKGYYQNPKNKQVLLYRGNQLWLSSDASCIAWSEATPPGPSGSQSFLSGITVLSTNYPINFVLRGLTAANTDNYLLYFNAVIGGGNLTVNVYKDNAKTLLVASSVISLGVTTSNIVAQNASGISGYNTWGGLSPADGTYPGNTTLSFSSSFNLHGLDGTPKFESIDYDFIVFIRGNQNLNVYVNSATLGYWELSTKYGYGQFPIASDNPEPSNFQYRYLYTYSRIVDPITSIPNPSLDRNTGNQQFEGPSNLADMAGVDYFIVTTSAPIVDENPQPIPLAYGQSTQQVALNAANYITHISIYRTLALNPDGTGFNGSDPEQYAWVADVPIDTQTYEDSTDDLTLSYRFANGAFGLATRFFLEMQSGIGAIGPDFMFTSSPNSTQVDYCALATMRFIGYNSPGAQQRFITSDVIQQIIHTAQLFIVICKYKTYYSQSAIYTDVGTFEFLPVIQSFIVSSETIGMTSYNSWCRMDQSSFAALCSDGTIQIFSGTGWGGSLDNNAVHNTIIQAKFGAVLGFIRAALYVFFTTNPDSSVNDQCLRYGIDYSSASQAWVAGIAGNNWSTIARPSWVYPNIGVAPAIIEDEDQEQRLIAMDNIQDTMYAIEDPQNIRQYKDDLLAPGVEFIGITADRFSNLVVNGFAGTELFGFFAGGTNATWFVYLTAQDRDNFTNAVMVAHLNSPINGHYHLIMQGDSGMSGTVDFNGDLSGPDSDLDVDFLVGSQIDIPWTVAPRELMGSKESDTVYHEESHIYARPILTTEQLPDDFLVSFQGYTDGQIVLAAAVSAVPVGSDIQVRCKFGGSRIQTVYSGTTTECILTGFDTQYSVLSMQSKFGPSQTPEYGYEQVIGGATVKSWLYPFSALLTFDRVSQSQGVGGTPTTLTGAQGYRQVGLLYANIQRSYDLAYAFGSSFGIIFWMKSFAGFGVPFLQIGSGYFSITFSDANYIVINGVSLDLSSPLTDDWAHFAIMATNNVMAIYQNGIFVGSISIPGINIPAGSFDVGNGNTVVAFEDQRLFASPLDAKTIAYYYDDVINNHGKKVLP